MKSQQSQQSLSIVLDEELTKYTAGWLLHDLITNPNIKGVKRETAIHNLAYKSCAFTDDGAAWLSRETNEPRSDFFYYNLVDDTLSLITSQAAFGRNGVAADDQNLYCICNWRDNRNNTHQLTAYIFDTTQPKHTLKNKTEFNLQGTFHDINLVYDKDNKSFILIAINVLNKQFSFYTLPLDNNTQDIIANRLTTQTTTIDLHNESNNLLHQGSSQLGNTWKCFDGKLVRTQRYLNNGTIETNLIICNLATQHIEYQGNFDTYMQQKDKTFSVMKYYAENDYYEPIISHQCIARHPLIPNYETIMSQRATNIEIEKEVEGLDAIMFDGEHMRYCIEKKRIAIPDKLIFYDLLPYELSAAIRFLSKNQNNLILNAWYVYHAALKTNIWKNIDQTTADNVAPEIKKWYPLPITKSQQKGQDGITSMLKQNLGALWERSKKAANYTYLMYGRTFKNTATILGGIALFVTIITLLGKDAVSKQIRYSKPVTISPGQSIQTTIPGSNIPMTILNRSNTPITGTPESILHTITTIPPVAQPAR